VSRVNSSHDLVTSKGAVDGTSTLGNFLVTYEGKERLITHSYYDVRIALFNLFIETVMPVKEALLRNKTFGLG
jgi:hypothetical protein